METRASNLFVYDKKLISSRDYWLKKLSGGRPAEFLKPDWPRAAREPVETETLSLAITSGMLARLEKITSHSPFLLYCMFVASLGVCMHKCSGSRRVAIGSPRLLSADERQSVVLPILLDVHPEMIVKNLVLATRSCLIEAYQNQDCPYDKLIADLGLSDEPDRCPLFDVAISMRDLHEDLPPLKLNLSILLIKIETSIAVELKVNSKLFAADHIGRLSAHYLNYVYQTREEKNYQLTKMSLA